MRTASAAFLLMSMFVVGGAAADEPKQPALKLSADEQKLLELTNAEREKEKLPPLKPSPVLVKLAREHSRNMAKQEKLDHELDCMSPFDRLKAAQYDFQRAGENVAMTAGPPSMAEIFKFWMDSDGHRAQILKDGYTEIGLGVAKNDKGETYCTQVFAAPFKKE